MIIDGHLDLAFKAVALGGDLRLSLPALRRTAYGVAAIEIERTPTVSLPAIRAAGIRVLFGSIFVQPAAGDDGCGGPVYHTVEEASEQGWDQLRYYRDLAATGEITLIRNRLQLAAAVDRRSPLPGVIVAMEGGDPLAELSDLEAWWEAGLRILGPAWQATRYSGGTGAPGPLTPQGRALVRAMDQYGIALDASHMAEESFWEALEHFDGPVIASHANCRAIVPGDRHLSDDMIRAIAERDGVIGIVPYNQFLVPDVPCDGGKAVVTLQAVVQHIEHLCELTGSSRHVALGSDFDGGFGVEGIPAELESIADLPRIGDALRAAGWPGGDIDNFLHGNWLRWLRASLPA